MTIFNGPAIAENPAMTLDFSNPKRFTSTLGTGNLVQNFNYNAATWGNTFPANASLTTGIDAPDGTNTAVRMTCATTGASLLRVTFNSFTPNGTDTYAVSFWVRLISGTTSTSSQLTTDLADGAPTGNYRPLLIQNKWVRVVFTGVPTATAKTFVDILSNNTNDFVLDFWGIKVENITAADSPYPFKELINNTTFNIYRPLYTTLDQDGITFQRTTSPATKHGGLVFGTMTGSLTSANFLYNNNTWEVWFKINDRTPEGSTNEGYSALAAYRGFHAGFLYTSTSMQYIIWDGTSTQRIPCTWTVGATGSQINEGSWYQIAVTRSGDTFTPYLNGVSSGTATTVTAANGAVTSNDLHIGGMGLLAPGVGNFLYYARNTLSHMRMYNRTLTAAEIRENFEATRRKFGI